MNKKKAFTTIEFMIVLAIIGIIVAAVYPLWERWYYGDEERIETDCRK